MGLQGIFLFLAVVLFGLGVWSRWWPTDINRGPYYPPLVCLGLFFWSLSTLIPLLHI